MKPLTYRDLVDYQSMIVERYGALQVRPEVPGTPAGGLVESDRRALAYLDAALTMFGRLGMLRDEVEGPLLPGGQVGSVWG